MISNWSHYLTPEGLAELDQQFITYLTAKDQKLASWLMKYRQDVKTPEGQDVNRMAVSYTLIALGQQLESFLAELFKIEIENQQLQQETLSNHSIFAFKKQFILRDVKREAAKLLRGQDVATSQSQDVAFNKADQIIKERFDDKEDLELAVSEYGLEVLSDDVQTSGLLDVPTLLSWSAHILAFKIEPYINWSLFKLPQKTDFAHLVPTEDIAGDSFQRFSAPEKDLRQRDGFHLTDVGMNEREALGEVSYCVYCHKNDGDFCSTGFPVKRANPELGFKENPLKDTLTGCPLDEKISEMHSLKRDGFTIGALAMIMVDNPMCALTGHRICNDCMKACIYQKQTPVDIPQVETRILKDVLGLPWGVEIYDLLTRWNPLRQQEYVLQPFNGKKVLVMGMGPAGVTMAHYLTMAGCEVLGADGLKIEPLPEQYLKQPIKNYSDITDDLADRITYGFGGVAEYGITVRWDKNFLKLAYITMMRRQFFQVQGAVRFGGTLTVEKIWQLGFDHLTIAVGAGLPRELNIPNSLAPGMRQANDFLMALQLTGAAKKNSVANLQVRLPAVVIGGGLTGVDTATEVQAYYITQVEKTLARYEKLCAKQAEEQVRANFKDYDLTVLDEFLAHGRLVQQERELAEKENRAPDFIRLIRQWGGVTIAYRKSMQQSPAYKRNHEEVTKALQEGIYYRDKIEPLKVLLDDDGHCKFLEFQQRQLAEGGIWENARDTLTLPARSIFVATGAVPNVAYAFEHPQAFNRTRFQYEAYRDEAGQLVAANNAEHVKDPSFGPFTSYDVDDKRVSFIGDTHPVFHGSVVKAVASAKRTYPKVLAHLFLSSRQPVNPSTRQEIDDLLESKVVSVTPLTDSAYELVVHAPIARERFQPGQFYKVQNFESYAKEKNGLKLQTESVALMAAPVENEPGQLSFIVLDRGVSSEIIKTFEPGESIVVMGPTGNRAHKTDQPQTYVVIGSEMAASVVRSLALSFKEVGHKIIFLANFKSEQDIFLKDWFENNIEQVHWLTGQTNQQVIERLAGYSAGWVWTIGNTCLLKAVQAARANLPNLSQAQFVASVYGPMQCMLKGVCAQCLQWQVDPATGIRKKAVYACSWQHQPMQMVEFDNIDQRLGQNSMAEKLTQLVSSES